MLLRQGSLAFLLSLVLLTVSSAQESEGPLGPLVEEDDAVVEEKAPLLGLIRATDPSFNNFIKPQSNPVFFEDPRNTTEANAIFINHHVPSSLGGGDVQVYAVQLRAALTENLSFIATKDFAARNAAMPKQLRTF